VTADGPPTINSHSFKVIDFTFRPEEKTPSFKIEKDTNHWVDFGKADGKTNGNIIDFGIACFKMTAAASFSIQ